MNDANKVFLIDDDRLSNFINKSMLRHMGMGYDVHTFDFADNALEALKELITNNLPLPELILLDVNMPLKDGWEFLEEITDLFPGIQSQCIIYMLSASVDKEDVDRAKGYAAVKGFIQKPLKIAKMESIMQLVTR
jgi:CheY-like chemotaxis protein